MKFQKLLMTGSRDMDKNIKNAPKMGGSPICDPKVSKIGLYHFLPLWCPNFMQKVRKILRAVSEIFTDGRTNGPQTDMSDYIGPPSVNPGSNIIPFISIPQMCKIQ